MLGEYLNSGAFRSVRSGSITDKSDLMLPLFACDAKSLKLKVTASRPVVLCILHSTPSVASVEIELGCGARLSLVHIFEAKALVNVAVRQNEGSGLNVTSVVKQGASVNYLVNLDAPGAEAVINGTVISRGTEKTSVGCEVRHNEGMCRSNTLFKGVALNESTASFRGLVYVARDAQKTDARQTSRNIEAQGARIESFPQLEIYADDVKCSHGATIGQLDEEAVYYLRQRGISLDEAKKLLLNAFVGEIFNECPLEDIKTYLLENVQLS